MLPGRHPARLPAHCECGIWCAPASLNAVAMLMSGHKTRIASSIAIIIVSEGDLAERRAKLDAVNGRAGTSRAHRAFQELRAQAGAR